jgi:ribose 5-phosphate isomerase RpiB
MADLQFDIERIVREVLRRLQSAQAAVAGTEPHSPVNATRVLGSAAPASGRQAAHPTGGGQALQLRDRVVTLALLEGRLEGVRRVLVPVSSLVTPAVHDELRKRQVELVRGGVTSPPAPESASRGRRSAGDETTTLTPVADTGLLVGVVVGTQDPAALVKTVCADLGDVSCLTGSSLPEVVQRVSQAIVGQRRSAVLLTHRPAAAVCVANRRRGVRATWGWSAAAAAEATQTMGANLLVIDPAAHSVFQVRRMIREFVQAGVCDCPAELQAALDGSGE